MIAGHAIALIVWLGGILLAAEYVRAEVAFRRSWGFWRNPTGIAVIVVASLGLCFAVGYSTMQIVTSL